TNQGTSQTIDLGSGFALTTQLFSGDYTDLTNTPAIPDDVNDLTDVNNLLGEDNVQSDWAETNTSSDAYILNKPTILYTVLANRTVYIEGLNSDKVSIGNNEEFFYSSRAENWRNPVYTPTRLTAMYSLIPTSIPLKTVQNVNIHFKGN